jgi:hypothetical protein
MCLPEGRICGVGLQAVLPDVVLMPVAAARPSTSSALISCAQGSLDALHRDVAQQQKGAAAAPGHVPVWLQRHASEVSNLHQCIVAFMSLDFVP